MCTTLYLYFCTPYNMLTIRNSVSMHHHTVHPLYPLCLPPNSFPSGNHYSVLYIYLFVFIWFVHLFCLFFALKNLKKKCIYLIYLFLAVLGLHCCVWAFSSYGKWELLFTEVRRLLIAVASLVEEHRF